MGTALAAVVMYADVPAIAQAQTTDESPVYELTECIDRALAASHTLRIARGDETAARADLLGAKAARWPVLSLSAGGRYVSEVNEIELPTLPPRTLKLGDNDSYEMAANAEVPLFTGGRLSASNDARQALVDASASEVSAESLCVVHDVRVAFFQALGADADVAAAVRAEERLGRHLEEVDGKIEVGVAPEEARLAVQSRMRMAEANRVASVERRTLARLSLGALLGQVGVAVVPSGSLGDRAWGGAEGANMATMSPSGSASTSKRTRDASGIFTNSPDEWSQRPEVATAENRKSAADHLVRATRSAYLPSVVAVAGVHYGKPGVQLVNNDWMDWATAGVELRWTLWDAGSRRAELERKLAESNSADEAVQQVRLGLEAAHAAARERVTSRREQLEVAEERVELESKRLTLTEGRYRQGASTESEFLDVQDDLADAESALEAARAALRVAEADLLYAVGR
ncbi:MAG: TolC family protein [Candidatus Eisenbacteria bacterium]|uniref:TolC family protein n=1 Tax=Eiseniibacteriota bacterium TaxID=2212470 RepID=A0A956NFN0_UNCEI|nr:TolC family protein [Candidatus Eisenbacteria bacterium]